MLDQPIPEETEEDKCIGNRVQTMLQKHGVRFGDMKSAKGSKTSRFQSVSGMKSSLVLTHEQWDNPSPNELHLIASDGKKRKFDVVDRVRLKRLNELADAVRLWRDCEIGSLPEKIGRNDVLRAFDRLSSSDSDLP